MTHAQPTPLRPLPSAHHTTGPARSAHPGRMTTPVTTRIGDEERTHTCDQLAHHYAAGRLDRAELEERMSQAVNARTRMDLLLLLDDLPPVEPLAAAPGQYQGSGFPRAQVAPVAPAASDSQAVAHAFAMGLFGFLTVAALGCTLLLLLIVGMSPYGSEVWLGAFGSAVASSGITYFATKWNKRPSVSKC